jgi:hypothetical protein
MRQRQTIFEDEIGIYDFESLSMSRSGQFLDSDAAIPDLVESLVLPEARLIIRQSEGARGYVRAHSCPPKSCTNRGLFAICS